MTLCTNASFLPSSLHLKGAWCVVSIGIATVVKEPDAKVMVIKTTATSASPSLICNSTAIQRHDKEPLPSNYGKSLGLWEKTLLEFTFCYFKPHNPLWCWPRYDTSLNKYCAFIGTGHLVDVASFSCVVLWSCVILPITLLSISV